MKGVTDQLTSGVPCHFIGRNARGTRTVKRHCVRGSAVRSCDRRQRLPTTYPLWLEHWLVQRASVGTCMILIQPPRFATKVPVFDDFNGEGRTLPPSRRAAFVHAKDPGPRGVAPSMDDPMTAGRAVLALRDRGTVRYSPSPTE